MANINLLQRTIIIVCKDKDSLRQYRKQIISDLEDTEFQRMDSYEYFVYLKVGTRIYFVTQEEIENRFCGMRCDEICIEEGVDKRVYAVLLPMLIRYGNMCIFNDIYSLYGRTNRNVKEYFKEN